MMFVFFFSSRRRHTRYWRDWSSDVCSSDLDVRKRRAAIVAYVRKASAGVPLACSSEAASHACPALLEQAGRSRLPYCAPVTYGERVVRKRASTRLRRAAPRAAANRSEEHTSELQSRQYLVCRL